MNVFSVNISRQGLDVEAQISNQSLVIMHNEDWYIPDKVVDKNRIIRQWNDLLDSCTRAGKTRLRAFCMMDCFFDHGFGEEVVDYEHTLPQRFEIPFIPICAYRREDIDKRSEDQKERLVLWHSYVWTDKE